MDSLVEHYRVCALRGSLDPDVAGMLIADYAQRDTAVSDRTLDRVPRPKPAKHSGVVTSIGKTGTSQ